MNKDKILDELKKKFQETKKELGFKSSYEKINRISYIEDMSLTAGYVSNQFSRQMINRMVETWHSWIGTLYSWLTPNHSDFISTNEANKVAQDEREEIFEIIRKIMYIVRKNKRIAFDGLKK